MELEYERSAMIGDRMPAGLSVGNQMAYQALASLYARYREKQISRDAASAEKREIVSSLKRATASEEISRRSVDFFRIVERYMNRYRKERTIEAADCLADAVDGFLRG